MRGGAAGLPETLSHAWISYSGDGSSDQNLYPIPRRFPASGVIQIGVDNNPALLVRVVLDLAE